MFSLVTMETTKDILAQYLYLIPLQEQSNSNSVYTSVGPADLKTFIIIFLVILNPYHSPINEPKAVITPVGRA